MNTLQYELNVLVKNKPITKYIHTDNNTYVEGRPGSEYTIEFKNKTNSKVCAIFSVDGLSIMDGKPAGLDSQSYVIDPYQTIVIPGWRLDQNEVAKFNFGGTRHSHHKGISYAEQMTNSSENVGVIGVMVFEEFKQPVKAKSWEIYGYGYRDIYDNMDSIRTQGIANHELYGSLQCNASYNSVLRGVRNFNNVGTGFGEAAEFKTTEVVFVKKNPRVPDSILTVYYDDARGLAKRGIDVKKKIQKTPSAFPAYKQSTGCKPPDGWNTAGGPDGYPKKDYGGFHR